VAELLAFAAAVAKALGWLAVQGAKRGLALLRQPKVLAAIAFAGLAVALAVTRAELSAQRAKAQAAAAQAKTLAGQLGTAEVQRQKAEAALQSYAANSTAAWLAQAEAAKRTAATLEQINRRASAATQEIDHAAPGLRLDDPLPRSLRDAIACARGDARSCAAAPAAAPGGVSPGAAQAGAQAGRDAPGAHRTGGSQVGDR